MRTQDVITIPLCGPIYLDQTVLALIDTEPFQRLRLIKQLAMAHKVYPGATHTRFEHALGVFYLTRRALGILRDRGELDGFPEEDLRIIQWAALLHDVGHHGGSAHALEAIGYPGACHETAGARFFLGGQIGEILASTGIPHAGQRIAEIVRGASTHPLAGLVSGDCDADKKDYLKRDAYHCGKDTNFDQSSLTAAYTLLMNERTGRREIGLHATALTAFEKMLYAKHQMYREVYFDPVVVSAAAMHRSMIITAVECELVTMAEIHDWTDEEVYFMLRRRLEKRRKKTEPARLVEDLVNRLRNRKLYDEVASLPLADAPTIPHGALLGVEARLAKMLGQPQGTVLLDLPHKPTMLSTRILIRMRDGSVRAASELEPEDGFAINEIRDNLFRTVNHVRLFAAAPLAMPRERFSAMLREAIDAVPVAEAA